MFNGKWRVNSPPSLSEPSRQFSPWGQRAAQGTQRARHGGAAGISMSWNCSRRASRGPMWLRVAKRAWCLRPRGDPRAWFQMMLEAVCLYILQLCQASIISSLALECVRLLDLRVHTHGHPHDQYRHAWGHALFASTPGLTCRCTLISTHARRPFSSVAQSLLCVAHRIGRPEEHGVGQVMGL